MSNKEQNTDIENDSDLVSLTPREKVSESEHDLIVLHGLMSSKMQVQKAVEHGLRPEMLTAVNVKTVLFGNT